MSKSIKKEGRRKLSKTKTSTSKNRRKVRSGKKSSKSDVAIQYVLPLGNGWVVKNSKLARFTFITDRKRAAVFYARSIAKQRGEKVEIHSRDSKVIKENYTRKR